MAKGESGSAIIVDNSPVDRMESALDMALGGLELAEAESERLKFLAMFDERVGDLFFAWMELDPTGATDKIERSTLYPTERCLDFISAVAARNPHGNIELADRLAALRHELPPSSLRLGKHTDGQG